MTPQQRPAPPPDLAGRHLAKFFTDHLAGERAASPRTIASYRDAIKLLLIWFKSAERIPPEKLRLADIDRAHILRFLDWLETERGCSAATRNQRLAVIKSFCRYTAVEQPDRLDQVTQILAIRQKKPPPGSGTDRRRDQGTARPARHRQYTRHPRHRAARPGLRHRRPRPRSLRPQRRRHPPRQPDHRDDPREGLHNPIRAPDGPDRPARRRLPRAPQTALRARRRPTRRSRAQPLQTDQIRHRQDPRPPG